MGATYTRQSSYTDGDVVQAADTNDEFDQLAAAFVAASGHSHDGTAGEGGPITKLLGTSITIGNAASGTDITVTFDGESNDGVLKWMEDEDYFEFSDDILIASTEKIQFRDTAIYINSSADGQLDLVADTEIQIAATTVDINGNVDVSGTLTVAGAVDFGDAALSNVGAVQLDSIAGDGDTNTSITFSGSDVITIANAGTNQVTFNDGSISPVTDSDVDLGTTSLRFKDVYIDSATVTGQVAAASLDISGDIDVDGTTNLDIVDIDGAVDMATTLQVDGVATFTGRDIHSGGITIANDGQIGSVGDADAIAIASNGQVTFTQTLIGTALDISGDIDVDGTTNLDVVDIDGAVDMASSLTVAGVLTGTSLDISGNIDVDGTTNLDAVDIDGAVDIATTLTVAGDVDFNSDLDVDGTTNLDVVDIDGAVNIAAATTIATDNKIQFRDTGLYINSSADGQLDIVADTEIQIAATTIDINGAINASGEIIATSLDISGDIDVDGTANLDIVDIDGAVDMASTLTVTGAAILNGGIDVAGDITLDAGGADILFKDDGTTFGSIINASSDFQLNANVQDKDIIFTGNDGGSGITALTLDMSAAGAATFNDKITAVGTSVFTNLDISGDIDVDGTTNLDVVDIDGAVDMASTLQVDGAITNSSTIVSAGKITADAGIDIDNFNIDGTTIALSSGNMTLDVAGNITIDADGGTVTFADAGSSLGTITSSGYSGTSATVAVSDSTANTNFPVVFHDESNALLDDTGALRYNPSTGQLLVPNLTVAGTTTQVDTVTMQAANAVVFEGATADDHETTLTIIDPTADRTINLPNQSGTVPVLAAVSTTQITSTPEEINLIDGGTSRGTTAVASGDGILINDGGTMRMTNVDTVSTYFSSHNVGGGNIVTTGALNSGSITSGFGAINNGSSAISSTGTITFGSLSDGTITATAFVDEDDMSSDSATLVPTQQSVKAYVDNNAGSMSSFQIEDDDGTEVTINNAKELKIIGSGVTTNFTDTSTGSDGDPFDLTITVDAAQTGITSLLATDIKIGEDDQTKIDFETADEIHFYAANAHQIKLVDGALVPVTDNDIDLGTSSLEFKDAYFDGTVTADAFAGPLTGNVTGNVSGTALTVTQAAQTAITSLGTLTALTVDNMAFNGNTLTTTSADFTIDASHDIILDSDSANWRFKDAGTSILEIGTGGGGGGPSLFSAISDADMVFKGNDGGSAITALTLDMSDAGTAIFNHDITLPDSGEIQLGNGFDFRFFHDGSNNYIKGVTSDQDVIIQVNDGGNIINALTIDASAAGAATFNNKITATELDISGNIDVDGTSNLDVVDIDGAVDMASTLAVAGVVTANAGVVVDNITIDGTEIDLSSGSLTIDAAAEIHLDADDGIIRIRDDGADIGMLQMTSNDFIIRSMVSDKDLLFKGNDGGSVITALTLDLSAAGAATFNNDVTAFSDKRLKKDIKPITNALPKVMQMQGVYYKRNDIEDAREQVGVLAQDMEAILPEVVLTADDEMQTKSVDYGKLTAILIESIKELKAEIEVLKGK